MLQNTPTANDPLFGNSITPNKPQMNAPIMPTASPAAQGQMMGNPMGNEGMNIMSTGWQNALQSAASPQAANPAQNLAGAVPIGPIQSPLAGNTAAQLQPLNPAPTSLGGPAPMANLGQSQGAAPPLTGQYQLPPARPGFAHGGLMHGGLAHFATGGGAQAGGVSTEGAAGVQMVTQDPAAAMQAAAQQDPEAADPAAAAALEEDMQKIKAVVQLLQNFMQTEHPDLTLVHLNDDEKAFLESQFGKARGLEPELSEIESFVEGGAVSKSEINEGVGGLKQAGIEGDTHLMALNPEQMQVLVAQFGEPKTNPITGLPSFFKIGKIFSSIGSAVKSVMSNPIVQAVAPMAINFFAPGLGTALGSMLGASGMGASILGSSLIGAGLGGISGGGKGALLGALSGGIGAGGGQMLGNALGTGLSSNANQILGNALLSGVGGGVLGGGKGAVLGAALGGLGTYGAQAAGLTGVGSGLGKLTGEGSSGVGLKSGTGDLASGLKSSPSAGTFGGLSTPAAATTQTPGANSILSGIGGSSAPSTASKAASGLLSTITKNPGTSMVLGLGALNALKGSGAPQGAQGSGSPPPLPEQFTKVLPASKFNYGMTKDWNKNPYYRYGNYGLAGTDPNQKFEMGSKEETYFDPSFTPVQTAAGGGTTESAGRYVDGDSPGQKDDVPALLSHGEFVIPADVVSALGDGNNKAGADRLYELMEKTRKHVRGTPVDDIPKPIKSPLAMLNA